MLHSALPRAYLATPGMAAAAYPTTTRFLAEEIRQQPYAYVQQRLDDSYARLGWYAAPLPALIEPPRRPPSPCPLDLSLKPPPTPSTPSAGTCDDCEAIEVDDEEDRRSREEARSQQPSAERLLDELEELEGQRGGAAYRRFTSLEYETQQQLDSSHHHHHDVHYEVHRKLLLSSPDQLQTYQQLLTPPPLPPPLAPPGTHMHAPMTPPSTPSPPQCPRRRTRDEELPGPGSGTTPTAKQMSPEKTRGKRKHARKLKFDEDTSSPVSGTVILGPDEAVVTGDIDPAFNIVEVTEEARAELAKIENRLGPYQCKLCRQLHDDAFQLAQHRCSRIAHVEYRCPECDKRFSCPANLASHRRWHKPRPSTQVATALGEELSCARCDARFGRQASLRKHLASHHQEKVGEAPASETA